MDQQACNFWGNLNQWLHMWYLHIEHFPIPQKFHTIKLLFGCNIDKTKQHTNHQGFFCSWFILYDLHFFNNTILIKSQRVIITVIILNSMTLPFALLHWLPVNPLVLVALFFAYTLVLFGCLVTFLSFILQWTSQ